MSPTDCWDETRRFNIARRFGSAMISNTDSTLFIYSQWHIRVKAYYGMAGSFRVAPSASLEMSHLTPDAWFLCDSLRVLIPGGSMSPVKITVRPNGPFRVEDPEGLVELVDPNGNKYDLTGKPAFS